MTGHTIKTGEYAAKFYSSVCSLVFENQLHVATEKQSAVFVQHFMNQINYKTC